MSLKSLAVKAANKLGRPILVAQKHSPTALFAVGVIGVAATVVLASRATLKLDSVIIKAEDDIARIKGAPDSPEYTEEVKTRDLVVVYSKTAVSLAKLYAPAVLLGVASIACLSGSHIILTRRTAALAAAYGALDRGFREYRSRVVEKFGEETDQELRYNVISREVVEEQPDGSMEVKTVKTIGLVPGEKSIYARLFDQANSRSWSKDPGYNLMLVRSQQNYANDLLRMRGHVFLNEVYTMLGMDHTREGSVVGWIWKGNGDGYIDFGVFGGDEHSGHRFVTGEVESVWLDFNVDGIIYDKI